MENKKRTQGVPRGKVVLIIVFIMYANYKFIYGAETIAILPPYLQLSIEVGLYVIGLFVGKPLVKDLKEYISRQISIITNRKIDNNRKLYEQQNLLKYICLDINDVLEEDRENFYAYLNEQGYTDFKVDVHPEKKEKPTETPAKETPAV